MAQVQVVLWELVIGERIYMRSLCRLRHAFHMKRMLLSMLTLPASVPA